MRLIALSYAPRIILLCAISTMIEIMIERWTNAEGETDFRWSVWAEGHRIQMGENTHSSAEIARSISGIKFSHMPFSAGSSLGAT